LIVGTSTAPAYEEFFELAWIEMLHVATISKVRMRSYVARTQFCPYRRFLHVVAKPYPTIAIQCRRNIAKYVA
jgi:hypothetical protein